MSKLTLAISILTSAAIGLGVGHWLAKPAKTGPTLPPSRSLTTVPDDFAPPGLEGEVRRILLEPDLLERTEKLSMLLSSLGPESLNPVRNAYDSVFLDLADVELVLFGEWWARFDPRTAFFWTNHSWKTRGSMPVLKAIMRAWGRTDPQAAMAATAAAPNNVVRRRWVDAALRGWDDSVNDGALEYAESLGQGAERQWALYVVTRRKVLRDGPEATIAWAEGLPDDDEAFKHSVFRRVAGAVTRVDPPLAVAFAERHLDGPYGKGLPRRIGMPWVEQEPEAAMQWLASLPPGENRNDGVQESFRQWLYNDPVAAKQWIQNAPVEDWLDPALSIYAKNLSRREPVRALRVAGEIHDVSLRNPTLGTIAREWLVTDEAAASAWLDQSGLPEDYIKKIRAVPESVRRAIEKRASGRASRS